MGRESMSEQTTELRDAMAAILIRATGDLDEAGSRQRFDSLLNESIDEIIEACHAALRETPGRVGAMDPEAIGAEVVQSISDSMPDDDTLGAQDLLEDTEFAHMFVLNGDVISRHVASVVENELDALRETPGYTLKDLEDSFSAGLRAGRTESPVPAPVAAPDIETIAKTMWDASETFSDPPTEWGGAQVTDKYEYIQMARAVAALYRSNW